MYLFKKASYFLLHNQGGIALVSNGLLHISASLVLEVQIETDKIPIKMRGKNLYDTKISNLKNLGGLRKMFIEKCNEVRSWEETGVKDSDIYPKIYYLYEEILTKVFRINLKEENWHNENHTSFNTKGGS